MTGNRFELIELYGDDHLIDNETNEKIGYDLHSPSTFNANWNNVCNLLNKLHEENRRLKKAEILANYRGEMISFADSLIDDLGAETMKEMWDKFREEKYEEWGNLE